MIPLIANGKIKINIFFETVAPTDIEILFQPLRYNTLEWKVNKHMCLHFTHIFQYSQIHTICEIQEC